MKNRRILRLRYNLKVIFVGLKFILKRPYLWIFIPVCFLDFIETLIRHNYYSYWEDDFSFKILKIYREIVPKKYQNLFLYVDCKDKKDFPITDAEYELIRKRTSNLLHLFEIECECNGIDLNKLNRRMFKGE